jgi:hypothetical protein
MTPPPEAAALAALSIVESLLLSLKERKILPPDEIVGLLSDAAAVHADAATTGKDVVRAKVAELITSMIPGDLTVPPRNDGIA